MHDRLTPLLWFGLLVVTFEVVRRIALSRLYGTGRIESTDDEFDVFISYRRKDANFARAIAELLMSNGLSVWFDEYQILLKQTRRLEEELGHGVSKCKAGILITNMDYVDWSTSKICRDQEAKPLLQRNPQIPIVNIGWPAEPRVAEMLCEIASHPGCHPKEAKTFDDVIVLLEAFFRRKFVHDKYESLAGGDTRLQWKINDIPVELNVNEWASKGAFGLGQDPHVGPNVVQVVDGHKLDVNIIVDKTGMKREKFRELNAEKSRWEYYEWGIAMAQQYVHGWSPRMMALFKADISKRLNPMYKLAGWCYIEAFSAFARLWSWFLGSKAFGVHLFHQSDLNHFAVTYRSILGWSRKYSVLVPDPKGGSDFEFVFTCGCYGRFEEFCRYAHRFTQVSGICSRPTGMRSKRCATSSA